jgi:hypothetical protein
MVDRQIDVATVRKLEAPRQGTPRPAFDDEARTLGELAGKSIELAHDTLPREMERQLCNAGHGHRFPGATAARADFCELVWTAAQTPDFAPKNAALAAVTRPS